MAKIKIGNFKGPKGDKGEPGIQGIQGARGDTGPAGLKGDTGDPGPQGATGARGLQGIPGEQGLKGDPGATGAKGETGPQGLQGVPGVKGEKGETGDVGPEGPQGLRGLQGERGATGADGPQGLKGDTGLTGPQGIQGVKGDTGEPGPQGLRGLQGVKGDKGDQGEPGVAGTPNLFDMSTIEGYALNDITLNYQRGLITYKNSAYTMFGFFEISGPGDYVVKTGTVNSPNYNLALRVSHRDSSTTVLKELGRFTSGSEVTFNITTSDINANGYKFRLVFQVAGVPRLDGSIDKVVVAKATKAPEWALSVNDAYLVNRDSETRLSTPSTEGNLISNSHSVGFSEIATFNASQLKEDGLFYYRLTVDATNTGFVQYNNMKREFKRGVTYVFSIDSRTTNITQFNYLWVIRDDGANYSIHSAGRHDSGNFMNVNTNGQWNRTWVKFTPSTDMVGVIRIGVTSSSLPTPTAGTVDFRLPVVTDQNRIDWFPSYNIKDVQNHNKITQIAEENRDDTYAIGNIHASFGDVESSTDYSVFTNLGISFQVKGGEISYNSATGEFVLSEGYWMIDASTVFNSTLDYTHSLLLRGGGSDLKWVVARSVSNATLSGVFKSDGVGKFQLSASQNSGAAHRLAATNRSKITLKKIY